VDSATNIETPAASATAPSGENRTTRCLRHQEASPRFTGCSERASILT